MTRDQEIYFKFHQRICDEARELSRRKSHDYASPENRPDDPFAIWANFMQCKHLNICTVEQGFCVRLSDKFSRLCNLLREGHESEVVDEKLEDTVKDIINYSILLLGYLEANSPLVPNPPDIKYSPDGLVATHERVCMNLKIPRETEPEEQSLFRDMDRFVWYMKIWEQRDPKLDPLDICGKYEKWRVLCDDRKGFVCPVCLGEYWGTSGDPTEPGAIGHCHGMKFSPICKFSWNRDIEDRYLGLTS